MDGDSMQNTMSSTSSSIPRHFGKPKKRRLIVEEQAKIERELDKSQSQYSNRPSTRVVITKWISTLFLGAMLLACLVLSKVSVIAVSFRMNSNVSSVLPAPPPGEPNPEMMYTSQLFVMLLIITLVPYVISLVRGLFAGLFREDIPWPSKKGFALATVTSLLESVGVCLFVFKISDTVGDHPYLLVLIMHSVFLVPVFTNLVDSAKGGWTKTLFVLAVLLEIAGTGGTMYLLYNEDKSFGKLIYVVVAILCLSIAWSPLVQRSLLKLPEVTHPSPHGLITGETRSTAYDPDQTSVMSIAPSSYSGSGGASTGHSFESYQLTESQKWGRTADSESDLRWGTGSTGSPNTQTQETKITPPTWKLTIYMSFLKIVFTFGTALILYRFVLFGTKFPETEMNLSNFADGWSWGDINKSGSSYEVYYFVANMAASAVGYMAGYIACTACMQRGSFSIPLFLATPLSIILLTAFDTCTLYIPVVSVVDGSVVYPSVCSIRSETDEQVIFYVATACLCLAQICCSGWLLFQSQYIVLLKEVQLFWTPMYNSILLEQWLMLVRKNEVNDDDFEDPEDKIKRSKVVICTTMYREADYEMRQLLESIQRISRAQSEGQRSFETHVFFDGAVKDKTPQEFVLQLVSLAESTLGVKAEKCTKNMTPYGMTLSWLLDNGHGRKGMMFVVHLKDNFKVKNKKRWSQVMYMSYVMDYLMNNASEMDTYILTTDADVKFTPDSVEALLDLMTRDHSVGAVCARTHPLGSGPLVWYQVFEYAIGHWFQKAAEHVVGSVLCSPGCFSVYRCKALRDILPRYASNVEHAFDFLTMDMGEDRWLCTLMVQSGWRIEYCAASENSTHCPEDFDEFYKQRRRWVASTLANIMLLLKEWSVVAKLNHRVTFIFLIYQAILLFATLIGPSSVMLVVSGGLVYGWNLDPITTIIVQVFVTIGLTMTCLLCSSKTQLMACKLVTFVYAIVMTATVVGTAVQIIQAPSISDTINVSTTTLYIAGMAGLFVLTGLLHLGEVIYLMHGVWFLLCLPSGYLVLIVYSICNITDRSWGTREVKVKSVVSRGRSWQANLEHYFKQIFFCCFKKPSTTVDREIQTDSPKKRTNSTSDQSDTSMYSLDPRRSMVSQASLTGDESFKGMSVISEKQETDKDPGIVGDDDDEDSDEDDGPRDVGDWLPSEMKGLANDFKKAGFDNTMLIAGMTEKELKDIGIKKKGIRQRLMEDIKRLPDYEIQADVPENSDKWLKNIGLSQYSKVFRKEQIKTSKDMEILKSFGRSELEKELKITKPGHIKRMLYAIGRLRNPTERERKLIEVRKAIDGVQENDLKKVSIEEHEFWDELRSKRLLPQSTVFGSEEELKSRLGELRNAWLMVFAVSNTLWLFLIETLASRGELLETYGSNPVGLLVLVLFSVVVVVQFFAMLVHRVGTLTHFLARAPYKFGDTFNTSWAFNEKDIRSKSPDDIEAMQALREAKWQAEQRLKQPKKKQTSKRGDKQPLLPRDVGASIVTEI